MNDISEIPDLSAASTLPVQEDVSFVRRMLSYSGWFAAFFFFLILFTILKLPEDRLVKYVNGTLSAQLADQGIGFSVSEGHVSFLRMRYLMKDVTLTFSSGDVVRLDSIVVSPALLSTLSGTPGGSITVEAGKGSLNAQFAFGKTSFQGSYDVENLDLGKLGVLKAAASVSGGAVASGKGDVSGDLSSPVSLSGKLGLNLANIQIDAQSIMGFPVPKLAVSEGRAEISLEKGRAVINTLRLGKPGNAADDVRANLTGDVTLGRNWPLSQLNVKSELTVSEAVLKSISLLDMLLGSGKQADGSYAFNLTGSLGSPIATPVPRK